jgi:hypothetical protein
MQCQGLLVYKRDETKDEKAYTACESHRTRADPRDAETEEQNRLVQGNREPPNPVSAEGP